MEEDEHISLSQDTAADSTEQESHTYNAAIITDNNEADALIGGIEAATALTKTDKNEEEEEEVAPPRERRQCNRGDGRGWRCSLDATPGSGLCEKHLLQRLSYKKNSANANGNGNSNAKRMKKKGKDSDKELQWPSHLAPIEGVSLDLPKGVMIIPPLVGPALHRAMLRFGVRK